MTTEKRHQSGSPTAWKQRRIAFRQHRVSNPNDPSPTNRKARREKRQVELQEMQAGAVVIAAILTPRLP